MVLYMVLAFFMIYAFTGKTGSGKTFLMAKQVFKRWYQGEDVYSNTYLLFENFGGPAGCNISTNPEFFSYGDRVASFFLKKWKKDNYIPKSRGRIFYFEDITEILEARDGVIMMDEGQTLLEARNWENLPTEFSNKLRQHRKHNLDLYTTTQNLGTIDINLRRLVQYWVHCKDKFALLGKRNPSWFSIHSLEIKDIDELYNKVDDLLVTTLKKKYFFIHFRKKRLYDTMYDIGFTTLKSVWITENEKKKCLIIPKNWSLQNARTQQLLLKFYLDPRKSIYSNND